MSRVIRIGLAAILLVITLMAAGCAEAPPAEVAPPAAPTSAAPPPPAEGDAPPPVESDAPPPPPESDAPVVPPVESSAPLLSGDLTRGCQRGVGTNGLAVGTPAVDFTLDDTMGQRYTLSAMLAEKPVMMVFGSFT